MRGRRWMGRSAALLALLLLTACVRPTAAAPAVVRTGPPPWDAPRDAISYIEAAGLPPQPLSGDAPSSRHAVAMTIEVDGTTVTVPAYVGMDRVRAQQAAVHTHDASNQVWLDGPGTETITLGQFFTLWGVRFDGRCLGAACGQVTVTADDRPVTDGPGLRLADVDRVSVTARS